MSLVVLSPVTAMDVAELSHRKVLTLAFIEKGQEVLLGFKKRGFGSGLWNGFGGKVEDGEEVPQAASREIKEECGLDVRKEDLEQVGIIHFVYTDDSTVHQVHVFKTSIFSGELKESEEMAPRWWNKDEVPYRQMWPDDEVWYPLLFRGINFRSLFVCKMSEQSCKILGCQINIVDADKNENEEKGRIFLEENNDAFYIEELWSRVKLLPVMSVPSSSQ